MNSSDICKRAAECSELKYWYGGKGELATFQLANRLRKENPSVWNSSYYEKALKDCNGSNHVGDCSYLVCRAYQIGDISSYSIRSKYPIWTGDPKDGMILWRKGHVGIYEDGRIHEMRGIDYDYRFDTYNPASWSAVLYDPEVEYKAHDYDTGWHQEPDGRWWYAFDTVKGSYYKNCIREINGAYYAFGSDGYMKEGAFSVSTDENGEIVSIGD